MYGHTHTHTQTRHTHFTCCSARHDEAEHTLQAAEATQPSQWTGDISTQTHTHTLVHADTHTLVHTQTAHGPHGVINK